MTIAGDALACVPTGAARELLIWLGLMTALVNLQAD
jgi:hypothetical protein